jgi:hypothetical protein
LLALARLDRANALIGELEAATKAFAWNTRPCRACRSTTSSGHGRLVIETVEEVPLASISVRTMQTSLA